jgi:hypothetical protein
MLESADWLNRGMPSFDVVSFGLQRLLVAGLVTIEHPPEGGLFIRAVGIPVAVVRAGRADYNRRRRVGLNVGSLGDSVSAMSAAIGAEPDSDPEDRSLGRLPRFAAGDLTRAQAAYSDWLATTLAEVAAMVQQRATRRRSGRRSAGRQGPPTGG